MSETRPKRSGQTTSAAGEFEDPLSNYDPAQYAGELERVLSEERVTVMRHTPFATIAPDATVAEVLRHLADNNYFSLLVVEGDKLVGIFSERDVLNKVVDDYETVKDKPIRELMTPDPVCVYETDVPAKALNVMAVGGFRRVPVLSVDDRVIGIIGPKRTVHFLRDYIH